MEAWSHTSRLLGNKSRIVQICKDVEMVLLKSQSLSLQTKEMGGKVSQPSNPKVIKHLDSKLEKIDIDSKVKSISKHPSNTQKRIMLVFTII